MKKEKYIHIILVYNCELEEKAIYDVNIHKYLVFKKYISTGWVEDEASKGEDEVPKN